MLDISKKYWIQWGNPTLAIRCSIRKASVVINLQQRPLFKDDIDPIPGIETYNISDKAKEIFLKQKEEGCLSPSAFPNKPETIEALKELEGLGFVVFYDVDEPIGRDFSEDELEEDFPPQKTLDEMRKSSWNSISLSYERNGYPIPEMPEYPKKEYGIDWYPLAEEEENN